MADTTGSLSDLLNEALRTSIKRNAASYQIGGKTIVSYPLRDMIEALDMLERKAEAAAGSARRDQFLAEFSGP